MTNQAQPVGKVTGHIFLERDPPWMYYAVLILCPDGVTISKQMTVSDKAELPSKGWQIPLKAGKLGFEVQ